MSILEIRDLNKSFGSLRATHEVNLSLERGVLTSVIGPNGAGKTTFFNLISGRLKPDRGQVILNGEDITGLPPYKIVRKGISRSFQITNIFPELTVMGNICTGLTASRGRTYDCVCALSSSRPIQEEARSIAEMIGLYRYRDQRANTLSHGDRKLLEFGLVLTRSPVVMLLDEPTAGMNQEETNNTVRLVRKIAKEKGITVMLTEHDIDLVFSISDRIVVLVQGQLIAEGTPEEIRRNDLVKKAYLGEE